MDFDRRVADALDEPFSGWDWSAFAGRMTEHPLAWDYIRMVRARLPGTDALLDLGTGGGELLASLAPLPHDTAATEGYEPNLPVAAARLEPLGVEVARVGADDRLPFDDARFDLVIDRHESFDAAEVARVLRPRGRFLTQQIGGRDLEELNLALARPEHTYADWDLAAGTRHLQDAGFTIVAADEAFPSVSFHDIGAIVLLCRITPWQVPGFDVAEDAPRLRAIHEHIEASGSWQAHAHRFVIEARLPD